MTRSLIVSDSITPEGTTTSFWHKTGFFMFYTKNFEDFLRNRNLKLPLCNDE